MEDQSMAAAIKQYAETKETNDFIMSAPIKNS